MGYNTWGIITYSPILIHHLLTITLTIFVFRCSFSLCLLLILSLTESVEDIPSVKKNIHQAMCQASKLLQAPSQDYKKLEVSDRQDWKLTPQAAHCY